MNRTKPQPDPPPPLVVGFLTATFVVGLTAAGLLLLGLKDVITSPALIAGAVAFVFGVLATAARGHWWQRKQRRKTGTAFGQRKVPEHIQRKALPLTLSVFGLTLALIASLVLGVTGHTAENRIAVMILSIIGLTPMGFMLFIFTYGYLAGRRER